MLGGLLRGATGGLRVWGQRSRGAVVGVRNFSMSHTATHCAVTVRFKDPDVSVIHDDLKTVARHLMKHEPWQSSDISVAVISGGITNMLYRLACGEEVGVRVAASRARRRRRSSSSSHRTFPRLRVHALCQSVLIRVFGEKTEVLINRERDNGSLGFSRLASGLRPRSRPFVARLISLLCVFVCLEVFKGLSDRGFGPKYVGTFENGRAEGWIPAKPLSPPAMGEVRLVLPIPVVCCSSLLDHRPVRSWLCLPRRGAAFRGGSALGARVDSRPRCVDSPVHSRGVTSCLTAVHSSTHACYFNRPLIRCVAARWVSVDSTNLPSHPRSHTCTRWTCRTQRHHSCGRQGLASCDVVMLTLFRCSSWVHSAVRVPSPPSFASPACAARVPET